MFRISVLFPLKTEQIAMAEQLDLPTFEARGISFLKTCFNGLNALSGIGLITIPYALAQAGWLSLGLLLVMAIITGYTGRVRKNDPCSLPIHKPITRSQTMARNNLVSEPSMSNHRLEQVENELGSLAAGQKELQQAMKASQERLLKHMESMFALFSTRSGGHDDDAESSHGPRRSLSRGGSLAPKITKLDFPRYNGMDDPTRWICRVEQFFEFQGTEEAEKLPMAGYHLDGDVQLWYQCFKNRREGINWEVFKYELHLRYGPSTYQIFLGISPSLSKQGSIHDYQRDFDRYYIELAICPKNNKLGVLEGTWNLRRLHPPWNIHPYPQHLLPELVPPPSRVSYKMGIYPTKKGEFSVQVADGNKMKSEGLCDRLPILVQKVQFHMDFYLLPVEGCDAIFGTQWLKNLGPIIWEFNELWMRFWWKGLVVLASMWFKDLSLLSHVSAGGVLSSLVIMGSILWAGAIDEVGFGGKGEVISLSGIPIALSLYAFSYGAHLVFPTLYSSMKHKNQSRKVI
ncbi:hypothetical protein Pint_29563 [Pistacia integerrima]|uniref:Uncharacterized protein n=1 Tax=Pistacia integerrima TaxID=434235 RepID=A0ACC0WYY5_9ROSI|nr:hypothetical protein Pint_29563 [Pistacia integerrima]